MWLTLKQWLPILSISLTAFFLVSSELIPIGILHHISEDLAIPASQIGLMITAPSFIAAIAAIAFPFIFKHLDRQTIFIALTIIMMISNFIVYLSPHYYPILFGRLILGVAVGGFATLSITSCHLFTPDLNKISISISIVMAGMTLATVLGLPLGIWISALFGWRKIFLIIAISSFILVLLQLKFLPKKNNLEQLYFKKIAVLVSDPFTQKHIVLSLLIFLAHFISYSYISILFKQVFSLSSQITAIILCFLGGATILGNIISAHSNKKNINSYLLFSFVLFCSSLLLILSHQFFLLYIACFLWGLAFGIFSSAINIFMTYYAPQHTENGMPLFTALIQLTITFASFLGGVLLKYRGIDNVFFCSWILFTLCTLYFTYYRAKVNIDLKNLDN